MAERKTIPVVIPFYKNRDELTRCLAALERQKNVKTEAFVRDNSDDNILYTRAVNEGLRKFAFTGSHDFILVLTQDVVLHERALDELVAALENNPTAGIAAPIQMTPQREITWAGSLSAFPVGVHDCKSPATTAPFNTFWANGACFLVRVAMIHDIGRMDANMMFICSDCDYSFTARARGWGVLVAPDAVCLHALKTSTGAAPPELEAVMRADQLYFGAKWLTGALYRNLCYEGESLSPLSIEKDILFSMAVLRQLKPHIEKFQSPRIIHRTFSVLKNEL
jgi:GT2 family glycosyltransferase